MLTVANGNELQLVSDVTDKALLVLVNKLGVGVNILCCKAAPWTLTPGTRAQNMLSKSDNWLWIITVLGQLKTL